jgi:hypothetical protein
MQHYEDVLVPQHIERKPSHVSCDLCGQEIPPENGYKVRETELSLRVGASYPGSGHGIEFKVDICVDCFAGRLVPWLRKQGCTVQETEWDY